MKNASPIAKRFREVLLDGRWIANTNYKELLSDLSWQQATTPIGSLNTIAALTFHIDYYIGGVLQVFEGGSLDIRDKYSFDLPPIRSQADWEKLVHQLWQHSERFAQHIESMSEEQLLAPFVKAQYGDYLRNIEGMIEHCYYHMGQIAILKKMILEAERGELVLPAKK
ncbi:MAG: DinB family protein [Bacteroidota bacterium]